MRFERASWNFQTGFHHRDSIINDLTHWHLTQSNADHVAEADRRAGDMRADPEAEEIEENDAYDERKNGNNRDCNEIKRIHGNNLANGGYAESYLRRAWWNR